MKKSEIGALAVSSILIAGLLGFVDEGHYSFAWMTGLGNWIALFVYAIVIFFGQLVIFGLFLRKFSGVGKTLASVFGGAVVGIFFVVQVIFTNW